MNIRCTNGSFNGGRCRKFHIFGRHFDFFLEFTDLKHHRSTFLFSDSYSVDNLAIENARFPAIWRKKGIICPTLTIGTGVIDCQVRVRANDKTPAHLMSVFKMSTVCSKSKARSKTWMPLPDCFIDDHLLEMFPLFDLARLKLVDVTQLRYTRSCSFPKSGS